LLKAYNVNCARALGCLDSKDLPSSHQIFGRAFGGVASRRLRMPWNPRPDSPPAALPGRGRIDFLVEVERFFCDIEDRRDSLSAHVFEVEETRSSGCEKGFAPVMQVAASSQISTSV
jgi:hypothetical protein